MPRPSHNSGNQYARMDWQSRWNGNEGPAAAITDIRHGEVALDTIMGTVYIKREDLKYLRKHLEAAVNLLRQEEE